VTTVFFNGQYIDRSEAHVSVDDRGFVFGDGVYEVIRSYGGHLFALDEHLARLSYGLRQLSISGVNAESFRDVAVKLLAANALSNADATVYIQVTRGVAPRRHWFPDLTTPPTTYAAAARIIKRGDAGEGITAIPVPDMRWARCDIKSLNILANCLAMQRARDEGGTDAILIKDGVALEGAAASLFGVFDGHVRTAPLTNQILPGITRQVALQLCREAEIPVAERVIFEHELPLADELFLAGTTVEIMPITQVGTHVVGRGQPGPVTQRLGALFAGLTKPASVDQPPVPSTR